MQVFWLSTLAVLMGMALVSLRWGVILYLVSAFIFPSLWLGETTAVRVELIYCLWLTFISFLRGASLRGTFKWHPILSRYGVFLLVIVLSTMVALVDSSSEGSVMEMLISFYGIFRPLLVMFVVRNIPFDEKFSSRLSWAFVWLAIPIAILSIGQSLGVGIAQRVTLQGYTSPSRSPVFRLLEEQGVIIRPTGVFESPVYNAVYWLLVLTTVGFSLVIKSLALGDKWFLYLVFGLAIAVGPSTLSSTFLVGAAFVVATLVLFLGYQYPKHFFRFAIGSVCVASIFVIVGLSYFTRQPAFEGTLRYQVDRILSGTLFYTRYDPEGGILVETYEAIQQRLIIGWGLTESEGAFGGDSIYTSVLYRGGIIGLIIFLWVVFSILKQAWQGRSRDGLQAKISWMVFLWTLILLVTGVGSPSFFLPRLQEWYWALVGMSLNLSSQSQNRSKGMFAN